MIVFRFNIHSVTGVGILVGGVCFAAGINEFIAVGASNGGWKVARAVLGLLFSLVGIVALAYPHRTFAEVAAIFSFFLVLKGGFDVFSALMLRSELDVWWVPFLVGVAEILAWLEVPESTALVIGAGADEQRPFRPQSP